MPTQRYETIIAAKYEGMGVAQQVLRDFNQIGTALENLERIGQRRSSAFSGLASADQSALIRTSVREVDNLAAALTRLRNAESARTDVRNKAALPVGIKGAGGFGTQPLADRALGRANVDVNTAADALRKEYNRAVTGVRAEYEAAVRRATVGASLTAQIMGQKPAVGGPLDMARSRLSVTADTGTRESLALQKAQGAELVAAVKRGVTAARAEAAAREKAAADLSKTQGGELRAAVKRGVDAARKEAAAREKAADDVAKTRGAQLLGAVATGRKQYAAQELADLREQASIRKSRTKLMLQDFAVFAREVGDARKQAAADLEGQRQQQLYDASPPTYDSPDTTTKLGGAQADYNKAERDLAIATQRRTNLINAGNPDFLQLKAADGMLDAATRRMAAARIRIAALEAKQSVGQQFMHGFRGASDRPYAEQIGQAFKFSVFYGTAYKLLFAFTTTMTATLQEGIAFQSAMTELRIASGASADAASEMAAGLSRQAVAAGQAPSVGVEIGARSLGLYGVTEAAGATQAEQQRVADISTRVVSRMALGSDLGIPELQTQLAAVANAFGTGAAGQIQAADLDAYLGRQFGVQQGLILQAVAESANVGQAAGFDQQQIGAIAAAMISRTGQSPSTAAGWMAQMFSRGGEGSLTKLTAKYGIDPNAELVDQMAELSQIYRTASSSQQTEILSSFGRGKVQNAAQVLVGDWDEIMAAAGRAQTESAGASEDVAEMRLGNIGGQIQVTLATMKQFASELGRSGVLDIVGAAVLVFRELVEGATALLQIWNTINPAVKGVVASLALLALASRTAAFSSAAGALTSPASLAARATMIGPQTAAAAAASSSLTAVGKAALKTIGPWAVAAGALMAIGTLKQSADRQREAMEASTLALNDSGLTSTSTPDEYLASASYLDTLATQQRDATGGFTNAVTFGQANDDNDATAETLELEAERLRDVAKAMKRAAAVVDAAVADSPAASAITSFDAEGLAQTMDLITASGGGAEERLDALISALDGTADAAVRAAGAIDPDAFAGKMSTLLSDGVGKIKAPDTSLYLTSMLSQMAEQYGDPSVDRALANAGKAPVYEVDTGRNLPQQTDAGAAITETLSLGDVYTATQTELQNQLRSALIDHNITSLADLDKRTAREIAEETVEEQDFDPRLGEADLAEARGYIVDMVARELRAEAKGWRQLLKGNKQLTATEVKVVIDQMATDFEEQFNNLPETDLKGRVGARQRWLKELRDLRGQTSADDMPDFIRAVGDAKSLLAQAQIDRLNQVRRAAQQNAKSAAGIRKAGMAFVRGGVAAALKSGDPDVLAGVIETSGKAGISIAKQVIAETIAAIKAALKVRQEIAALLDGFIGPIMAGVIKPTKGLQNALANAQDMSDAIGNMTYSSDDALDGGDVEGTDKYFPDPVKAPKGPSAGDKKAEREEARQAMLELRNNLYLLSIDMTDPLAMAVAAVRDARRRLKSDLGAGADKNTIAADRVALRQSQAEREATAFQQRLDAVTTAEELGRISHRKYISYLESERRRLNQIKDRTFQQQSQLDQIDRLMKDAAESMQGMWNFGDIKLPTPYQIRRQVEGMRGEGKGGRDYGGSNGWGDNPFRREQARADRATQLDATSRQVQNNSTIYIDGADTGKVRQIITETLAKSNATVTNRPRRR